MTQRSRRTRIWLAVAVVFSLANLGGAVMAAAQGELVHTLVHVVLLVFGAFAAYRLWRPVRSRIPGVAGMTGAINDRLTNIEQSIEAVATEVERVGEGQRFISRVFAEGGVPPVADDGSGEIAKQPDAGTSGQAPRTRE
jgi:uncharacterized membrane protein YoaK (UPF0700 family)